MGKFVFLAPFFIVLSFLPTNVMSQEVHNSTQTYLPLEIKNDQILYVNIIGDSSISNDKVQIVKESLLSTDSFSQDGKSTFKGWEGALLEAAKTHTHFPLPVKLKIVDSPNAAAQVTIALTSIKSDLGYSGYTSITKVGNMLKKAHITIYEAGALDNEQLAAIARHEFGHALGLGHSNLYGDLMYPEINLQTSLISDCDEQALRALYNGHIMTSYEESSS